MRTILCCSLLFLCTSFFATPTFANSSHLLIYGKVTTVDDEVYTGQIRWGKEEAFWFDIFNSSKPENDNLKYLSDDEIEELNEQKKKGWVIVGGGNNWSYNNGHTHSFACQFGDIKNIVIHNQSKITLTLKNNETIKLKGGSNDIGATVQVNDSEVGLIKIDWDRIAQVEFMKTPSDLESYFGAPLYGTVETSAGSFTGFVQWDHDERLANDVLDGENEDGDMEIRFGKIKSIRKATRSCEVLLQSGRTLQLSGSNDVNSSNGGIIVSHPNSGRVDIRWEDFKSVTFSSVDLKNTASYGDYKGENSISGTVTTNAGKTMSGQLIYDLDEQYHLELLNGNKDDIEYLIPFSLIAKITPLNREESKIQLHDGSEYVLENSVDVSEDNDGVLVCDQSDKCQYIKWSEVSSISIKK